MIIALDRNAAYLLRDSILLAAIFLILVDQLFVDQEPFMYLEYIFDRGSLFAIPACSSIIFVSNIVSPKAPYPEHSSIDP